MFPTEIEVEASQIALDGLVALGGPCLAPEWPHLPLQLLENVAQSEDICIRALQPAYRSLFSQTVLENPGCLFDNRPVVLGLSVQDRVELTLAHDDVLVTPNATVGQQLLHVQKPAVDPVDLIVAAAVSVEPSRNVHLIEVEWQQARGIVEHEGDFGPAQGRTGRRAGEDDVLHLLGSQGSGRLGAHHPGEGVDQIRLARSIGTDHHGHTRLELQPGSVGERLEPDDLQGSQIHKSQPCYFGGQEAITAPRERLEPHMKRREVEVRFRRGDLDLDNRRQAGAGGQPGNQVVYGRRRSLGQNLNLAGRDVANPPCQPSLLGFPQGCVAEPDALHAPGHDGPDGLHR